MNAPEETSCEHERRGRLGYKQELYCLICQARLDEGLPSFGIELDPALELDDYGLLRRKP